MKIDTPMSGGSLASASSGEVLGQQVLDFGDWVEPTNLDQIERQLADVALSLFEMRHIEYSEWRNFFCRGFHEVRNKPYDGKVIHGPHYDVLNELAKELDGYLKDIHPELKPECFYPDSYRSRAAIALGRQIFSDELGPDDRRYSQVGREYTRTKAKELTRVARSLEGTLTPQELPKGILDEPDYSCMYTSRSCVATSFLMVMESIGGEPIDNRGLYKAVAAVHDAWDSVIEDEEYLKLLESRAFQDRFNQTVQTVTFTGGDLSLIRKIADGMKRGNPERKVHCVLSLQSDTSYTTIDAGIWHSAVLLDADEHFVRVHEPTVHGEGESRRMPKHYFFERWAQAYMRGHLIISEPIK